IISVETLDLKEMMKNKYFSKKISDISYNRFVNLLVYKAKDVGKILHKVNKYYASSKICSVCGNVINRRIGIMKKLLIRYSNSITQNYIEIACYENQKADLLKPELCIYGKTLIPF
ncbi:MAG: IS200/IS605 family accessory protein TnpB-related protein, partial [Candidatus Izemoplasma sp.]